MKVNISKVTYTRARARDDYLDDFGREKPDPIPMAPPIGYVKQESLSDKIRSMVRSEHLRIAAMEAGAETFEEADDFEVGEDYDPKSPYEEVFDPVDSEARMRLRQKDYAASVDVREQQLRPVAVKEDENGVGQGRMDGARAIDPEVGSGKSDPVSKGKSGKKSDDGSRVSGAAGAAREGQE